MPTDNKEQAVCVHCGLTVHLVSTPLAVVKERWLTDIHGDMELDYECPVRPEFGPHEI